MDETKTLLLAEWREIRESIRYFGNKRFAQLTVFIAATGFLLSAFLDPDNEVYRSAVAVVGLAIGLSFLVMECRSVDYWKSFVKRAEAIEKQTGTLELAINHRPDARVFSGTNAMYAIYLGILVLWIYAGWVVLPTTTRDAPTVAGAALQAAPALSKEKTSVWSVAAMNWTDAARTYDVELHDQSGNRMLLVVDARSGRITKVENP